MLDDRNITGIESVDEIIDSRPSGALRVSRSYPMTFKTLGATAPTRPQTKVRKLVILVHEGMHMRSMTAFLRETIYTNSLGKLYIYSLI
jgi:hypothetical protein